MAKNDYQKDIQALNTSLSYLALSEDKLNSSSLKILNKAYSLYESYWVELFPNDRKDPRITDVYSFRKYVAGSGEIERLILRLTELRDAKEEDKEKKPKEQEASIPPELESLVAEYQQNQALLESEEVKSNSQRSVAEQVKIAIAHSKIKDLALANKQRRLDKGEKFQDTDKAFTSLGSPKSESQKEALDSSYQAIQEVARTYPGFSKLSTKLQETILDNALELHTIGLSDLDTAIQSSTLQIDSSSLSDSDKTNLATIPGGFVSTIYQEIKTQDQKAAEFELTLNENEQKLIQLEDELLTKSEAEKAAKTIEIKAIIAENEKISLALEEQDKNLSDIISKQTEAFKTFSADREKRLSKDPDTKDRIEASNRNIASIQSTLDINGVKPNLFDPLKEAHLLEQAIRQDMPGVLSPHAGYEAEYAASLISNPKTRDPNLSPEAVLLAGKKLDPKLLAQARLYAEINPNSALGKLFKTRKDIFDAASTQIRKITNSPLGKEISKVTTGIGKVFKPVSGFIGKISDKIPGGFGNLLRIVQDPVGALRSWAGKKVGTYVVKKILASTAGKAALAAGKKLAGELLKKGIGKAVAAIAAKLGIKVVLAGTVVGAPVALALLALDIIVAVFKAIKNSIQKTAKALFGEEIKSRDALGVLAIGMVSRTGSIFASLGSATASAAGSAGITIGIGAIVVFMFYVTSFAVAPLLSTLVQLESTPHTVVSGSCSADLLDVVDRAVEINNGLQSGFNNSFNKSPDYPELWNSSLFSQNPNPESQYDSIDMDDMFWCNYLVFKPYNENGKELRFHFSTMISDFQTKGVFYKADDITISDICPGMAVFFKIPADSSSLAHVALVTSVSADGFTTVESNATYKSMFYPVDTNGNFQIINTGGYTIKVESFGSL